MPATSPLPESEVRQLVRRVVEGSLDAEVPVTSSPGEHHDAPGPDAGPSAGGSQRIAVGADHGGFKLKQELVVKLGVAEHEVVDCGTDSAEPADYPAIAHDVARRVADGSCRWGIIIDGAGIGSAMVANKVPGIRAARCHDLSSARNSREHNHANVLTLGAGTTGAGLAWQIVQEWLAVPWGPDRHARRVMMIDEIEHTYSGVPS